MAIVFRKEGESHLDLSDAIPLSQALRELLAGRTIYAHSGQKEIATSVTNLAISLLVQLDVDLQTVTTKDWDVVTQINLTTSQNQLQRSNYACTK